jgi:Na+/H+-dicarboxylate symporter
MKKEIHSNQMSFTKKIMLAMLFGVLFGYFVKLFPDSRFMNDYLTHGVLEVGGRIFIAILKMLVVPLVFVSLVCGTCQISDTRKLGGLALKTFALYILTTAIAIALAIFLASLFNIGTGLHLTAKTTFTTGALPSLKDTIVNIIPSNPIQAMAEGNMLQVIVFALLFGYAISISGKAGRTFSKFFNDANTVLMKLIFIVLWFAPYGVFCLLAKLFASEGIGVMGTLLGYFLTVLLALGAQWLVVYGLFLKFFAKVSPFKFYKKMYAAMLFAFSTSSSSASIPVVLDTAENKLGIHNSVASFVIPLGATINMDGTSIMQGVATVFIAHIYGIDIGLMGYLMVILTATLASIGTAGVPGVGLITLTMVLQQVGLPVEGISLIIGIDRLLDMTRTAVNISGDCMVATVVANSQNELNHDIYNSAINETTTTAAQMKNWHE